MFLHKFRIIFFAIISSAMALGPFAASAITSGGWVNQRPNAIGGLTAIAEGNGWRIAVGDNGLVVRSSDGKTWSQVPSGINEQLTDIYVLPSEQGGQAIAWAVGISGRIIRSTDNGASWIAQNSGTAQNLDGVFFWSGSKGWAVGENGTILQWNSATQTWIPQNSGTAQNLKSVFFINEQTGWAVGLNGTILKTDNGGQNWALKPSGTVNNLLDVHFTSLFDGFAVGAMGTILISFDGGMSWINRSSALLNDNVYSVVFANVDLGWVAGGNNTVLETRNNASTWAQYGGMSVAGGLQISDLLMANGAVGWVTDLGGAIWRYDVVPPSQPGNLRVSGGSPTKQSSPTILWDAATDEETAIKEYWAKVDGWSPPSAIGNGNSTSWSSQDFLSNLSEGSHTIELYARDEAGNAGATGVLNFIVDTLAPTMSALSPTTATAQSSVTLAGTASDASGVTSCNLFVNNADVGSMGLFAANQVSRSHTFASAGSFTVQARCQDVLGNQGSGPTTTVTVQAASGQNPPPANNTPSAAQSSVSVSPAIVVPNNLTTSNITVTVRNSNGIVLPGKVVSLVSSRPGVDTVIIISSVTNDLGQATFAVKSSLAGSSTLTAVADGLTIGSGTVSFALPVPIPEPQPGQESPGNLMKISCPNGALADHPCKAVYYYGSDGKRHAFPHEKVYFTWYGDFSNVKIVTGNFLASIPLGKNVTYRPGVRMVKFLTLNNVYAVSKSGVLRWVTGEEVARSLYGISWNKQIDDIADTFFTDYRFGADIRVTADYSPTAETNAVLSIDANL